MRELNSREQKILLNLSDAWILASENRRSAFDEYYSALDAGEFDSNLFEKFIKATALEAAMMESIRTAIGAANLNPPPSNELNPLAV